MPPKPADDAALSSAAGKLKKTSTVEKNSKPTKEDIAAEKAAKK